MKRRAILILVLAGLLGSSPAWSDTSPWVVRTFTYAWNNGEQVRDYRYRVAAYGPPPNGPVPLLVQLHEWVEGSASLQLRRPEEIVQYEDGAISFLMLYFEHAPPGVYPSPYYNWWWGDRINDRFWVFAAATTNVETTLRVTDTATGNGKSYFNPLGNAAAAITDTSAFASCPTPTP